MRVPKPIVNGGEQWLALAMQRFRALKASASPLHTRTQIIQPDPDTTIEVHVSPSVDRIKIDSAPGVEIVSGLIDPDSSGPIVIDDKGKKKYRRFYPSSAQSSADKKPREFRDEAKLSSTWNAAEPVLPARFTGLMEKAVSVFLGMNQSVPYRSNAFVTHGIHMDGSGKPWVIEISNKRGVFAYRLETYPDAKPKSTANSIREDMGFIPKVTTLARVDDDFLGYTTVPVDEILLAEMLQKDKVRRLLTAEEFEQKVFSRVFDSYNPIFSWAFNESGSEAALTNFLYTRGDQMLCQLLVIEIPQEPAGPSVAIISVAEAGAISRAKPAPLNIYSYGLNPASGSEKSDLLPFCRFPYKNGAIGEPDPIADSVPVYVYYDKNERCVWRMKKVPFSSTRPHRSNAAANSLRGWTIATGGTEGQGAYRLQTVERINGWNQPFEGEFDGIVFYSADFASEEEAESYGLKHLLYPGYRYIRDYDVEGPGVDLPASNRGTVCQWEVRIDSVREDDDLKNPDFKRVRTTLMPGDLQAVYNNVHFPWANRSCAIVISTAVNASYSKEYSAEWILSGALDSYSGDFPSPGGALNQWFFTRDLVEYNDSEISVSSSLSIVNKSKRSYVLESPELDTLLFPDAETIRAIYQSNSSSPGGASVFAQGGDYFGIRALYMEDPLQYRMLPYPAGFIWRYDRSSFLGSSVVRGPVSTYALDAPTIGTKTIYIDAVDGEPIATAVSGVLGWVGYS